MNHLFVINPTAGKKDKTEEITRQLTAYFGNSGAYEVYRSDEKGGITAYLKERLAADSSSVRVYACGGDGTLNEALNGIAGCAHAELACYPCGTGNDFIKSFPEQYERFFDLSKVIEGTAQPIDVIRAGADNYSINICSAGLDARVGRGVAKYKRIPLVGGMMAYSLSLVREVIAGIATPVTISIDGEEFSGDTTIACVCNGSFYGGGFHPVPEADLRDGMLDVLVVKKVSRLKVAALVSTYAKGRYKELSEFISYRKTKSLSLHSEKEIPINLDGEILMKQDISFQVLPAYISFVLP